MSKKTVGVCVFIGIWLCMAESGFGTVMRLEVEGIVNIVGTGGSLSMDGSVQIGSTMSGYALYDSDAPDRDSGDNVGDYPVMSIWMEIGNYVFYEGPVATGSLFRVVLNDPADQGPRFSYSVGSIDGRFSGSVFVGGVEKGYDDLLWGDGQSLYEFELMDVGSSALTDDDGLPVTLPDIGTFDWYRRFGVSFLSVEPGQTGDFSIGGELTSVRIIPEPGTVALLSLGGLLAFRRRRSR